MLGLGNSLTHSSVIKQVTPPFVYSTSVIDSSEGWDAGSIYNNNYDLIYNEEAPDGTPGWMKLTINEDQTNTWWLQNTDILSGKVETGSTAVISFKIFLDTAALWGDGGEQDDGLTALRFLFGSTLNPATNVQAGIATPTTVSNSITATTASSAIQIMQISSSAADLPLAGAEVYIKDLSISITYV